MQTWFENLMGFAEESPEQVRSNIVLDGEFLVSRVNGARVRCGRLSTPSLAELRVQSRPTSAGRPRVGEVVGDVGELHRNPAHAGALFQAASQFNLLEMAGPDVAPERGVGIYEYDRTQGPACAIACGGGTIYRNYFVEVDGEPGQTATRQIDCLADLEQALGGDGLWQMRNGYALATEVGLQQVNARLAAADEAELDELRGLLRIGIQHDTEAIGSGHLLTQVYGSAMPVAYGEPPGHLWEPLARLVLEASYEATLRVARLEGINTVFLTLLGGGVFGNERDWIEDAITRALSVAGDLDIRIVSYGRPNELVARIIQATSHSGNSQ